MVQLSLRNGPTLDAMLAAKGLNRLASSVRPCFVVASLTVEKVVSCYKADKLIASLLSSCTFSRRLQYTNFMQQGKNTANEATDRCVRTFDA